MPDTPNAPTIALAVRGGLAAKSRCARVLSPRERARLSENLLDGMLAALEGFPLLVVTPTKALAELAAARGARTILEPRARGLNAAFRSALALHRTGSIALVPADLPFLTAAEVQSAAALLSKAAIVVAPSRGGGTGGLFLRDGVRIAPSFGSNSAARHRTAARAAGLACTRYDSRGFLCDIDTPEDLSELRRERQRRFGHARAIGK